MTDDYNRSTTKEQHRSSLSEQEDKSRKFRWSSCFSFISKFKKPKQPKLRLSQSVNEFEHKELIDANLVHKEDEEQDEDLPEIPRTTASLPWRIPPPSSLSPPPRRRDSQIRKRQSTPPTIDTNMTTTGRRPLMDPTLTPRVKPRSIKSKKQPSLLRLSLDAEPLQSPVDADTESVSTTGHSSSLSFTPTSQPFRSGTLGAHKTPKLSITSLEIPPMPHIPHDSSSCSTTRPNSQSMDYVESPVEHTSSTEDEEKLTLKERRHRRSPLAMPDTDQLILALKAVEVEERSSSTYIKRQPTQVYYDSSDEDDQQWRHQLLEQSIAYSFTNNSRQEAMMSLEGKKAAPMTLQPIVNVHDLDHHFDHPPNSSQSVVRDKAQYDAAVSRRSSSTMKKSAMTDKLEPLDSITENEIVTNVTTPTARLLFLSVTPQTPPHHQQNAPSLISAPSTPNSIDSSVPDQEDYLDQEIHHHLASLLQSI